MLLALSIFLTTGTTLSANAHVVEYPEDDVRIEVNSSIGEFDNTDPGGPDPIDPDTNQPDPNRPTWLNITVPTAVAFHSTGAYHENLTSVPFTITNNSGRGVNVYVAAFNHTNAALPNGSMNAIETLALTPQSGLVGSNVVNLVNTGGVINNTPNALLMTIERVPQAQGATNATFEFTGTTNLLNMTTMSAPAFDLILEFAVNGAY